MNESFSLKYPEERPEYPEKVIITGGTEGLGLAIVENVVETGRSLALCARTKERVDGMNEIAGISAYQVDLADRHAARGFGESSLEALGGVDALVLNAAVTGILESEEEVFRVNEVAPMVLTRTLTNALRRSHGRIIFITSAAKNIEGVENYGKSKARIEEWLTEYSQRAGNEDIQIFSIIPGSCDTRMHREILAHGAGEVKERTEKIIQGKGLRDPKVVGKIIAKMTLLGKRFNPETGIYDLSIKQCEVVMISDENVMFEESK